MERIIQRVNFYNLPKIELKRVAAYARVSSAKDSMLHALYILLLPGRRLITHRINKDSSKTDIPDEKQRNH